MFRGLVVVDGAEGFLIDLEGVAAAQVLPVLLAPARHVAGKHPEIRVAEQREDEEIQELAARALHEGGRDQQHQVYRQKEEIQLVIAVSADHETRQFFLHSLTRIASNRDGFSA